MQILMNERNSKMAAYLRNPTQANQVELANIRSHVQMELRNMQNEWWSQLATEIQGHADSGGNQQEFYAALKSAYGSRRRARCPVRNADW